MGSSLIEATLTRAQGHPQDCQGAELQGNLHVGAASYLMPDRHGIFFSRSEMIFVRFPRIAESRFPVAETPLLFALQAGLLSSSAGYELKPNVTGSASVEVNLKKTDATKFGLQINSKARSMGSSAGFIDASAPSHDCSTFAQLRSDLLRIGEALHSVT